MSFNPVTFTPPEPFRQTLPPRAASDRAEASPQSSAAMELTVWLAALPSFFDLKNHPRCSGERETYSIRDYSAEAHILQQALRHCLSLCLLQTREHALAQAIDDRLSLNDSDVDFVDTTANLLQINSSTDVWQSLSELYLSCRVLTRTAKVDVGAWMGLCRMASRALDEIDSLPLALDTHPHSALRRYLPRIQTVFEFVAERPGADEISSVLSSLAHCLEQLEFVGKWLLKDRPIKLTLPLFTHVSAIARRVVSTLETMARRAAGHNDQLSELYDSAGYAIGMELNKVFNHELLDLAASRLAPTIYTRVENAHGLLRDCFQQTIITCAQEFDSSLDAAKVFDTQLKKLQNSLRLRDELWTLSQLVSRAEREGGRRPLAPLVARLHDFQQDVMRYLMYKDWESFERFVAEIEAARGAVELVPVLHRFGTYLSALFNQINMRAALVNYPFTPPTLSD